MPKRTNFFINRQKLRALVILLLLFSFLNFAIPKPAQAQMLVWDSEASIRTNLANVFKRLYEKGGAAAFQTAVRSALNKIAYDTATWIGSGASGQKPLFVTEGWGNYLADIGDEAAGQFLETAVSNWQSANWKSDESGSALNEQCTLSYNKCVTDSLYYACFRKCPLSGQTGYDENCFGNCRTSFPKKTASECETELHQCAGVITGKDGVTAPRTTSQAPIVCRPSSIDVRLKIAMGLVDVRRPKAPNCSASELVESWDDYYQRIAAYKNANFLDVFSNLFNPAANDLGIYQTLKRDSEAITNLNEKVAERKLIADGGWLDMRDIAGNIINLPGDTERRTELSQQGYMSNIGQFSGDALVDAANVFLNQLAVSFMNKGLSKLGQTVNENNSDIRNASSDPNIRYGEGKVKESLASIVEPNFTTRADYNILLSLSICRDRANPGPTECVIDERLVQGITEKVTVAEAVKAGYLRRDWQFTSEYRDSAYNLRNIQIMRKYRIVPVGWEVAASLNKKASLIDLMSCFDANDEYNEYNTGFDVRNQAWCRGLVDPNWVLKAPLNYCSKQGYSAQILNINVIPSSNSDSAIADKVQILRAGDYCADDQTCIDENSDGSCEAYGYCLSERRTWNFSTKSCKPIDNTCSAFVNSKSGQKVAYLENTLDYAECTADSVGCQRYSTNGSYDTGSAQVTWSANPFANAYFNNKIQDCSTSAESCQEMMRVKPGWGVNLVMGADFSHDNVGDSLENSRINDYWNVWSEGDRFAQIIDTSSLDGISLGKAIRASSTSGVLGVYSDNALSLLPANLNVLSGETYTLSADVYLISGDKIHLVLGSDYETAVETTDKEVWRHLSVTRSLQDQPMSELAFSVMVYSETGLVDMAVRNVKLEMNSSDSGFSLYGANKIYQKLIPNYLKDVCYVDANSSAPDYRLRSDAPAVCNNFARECNLNEAGCERFTESSTRFSVAAQAVTTDYCDASCNGYDLYVTRSNYFYSPQAENIIPKNSKTCSAKAVGCSEFTNLDEQNMGGENKEYYVKLKQCIKPGAECADFYTWIGTEESGYQLKSFILQRDANGNPASTSDTSQICNENIFNLSPSDPAFNPDCRQYYNKAGQISYRQQDNTITCSDNCHSYRLTENNVDSTLSQVECTGVDRSWNAASSACYVCKNGGLWSNEHQACLYQAIPNEGIKCSASENGCREYNGNLGNNTKLITANSFASDLEGWEGQCGDATVYSAVSNSNNGQSLMYDRGANAGGALQETSCDQSGSITWLNRIIGSAKAAPNSFIRRILGKTVSESKAYSLKFTASANADTNVYFAFLNSSDEMAYFNASDSNQTGSFTITGNNEWRTYEINLPVLDHIVDNKEALVIAANEDFYLDNLVLTEITNRYYLIKNTSQIPDVCYYDMLYNYQGADYNLGCSLYSDRFNYSHYLRQFNKLCQDSAVGCELMINTANFDDFKGNIWKDANSNGVCDASEPECIEVEGDKFFYAIYDKTKQCNAADLGCSRMGSAVSFGQNLAWSDVFKRNNPNQYDQMICTSAEAGCEAWQYVDGSGSAYFKNPGNEFCVYRNSNNPEQAVKAWYRAPVMRCDLNNSGAIDGNELGTKICSASSDCAANRPCIMDNNDYECTVSYFKTFGLGGGGQQIPVPSETVAACEPIASGCSEYIDPISSFATNLVKDPNYDDNNNAWNGSGYGGNQTVVVEPNSLYIFSVSTQDNTLNYDVRLQSDIGVSLLQEDNNLSTTISNELVIPSNSPSRRYIFYSRNNTFVRIFGPNANHEINLKKAIIDYQLKQNIDKNTCNGLVNVNNGCILFNERSINGSQGLLSLSGAWNAAASSNGQAPQACTTGNCDSNTLIKVRPDRTCASWLDCLTYVVDPETNKRTCYALGECNALNDQGECINFIEPGNSIITADNADLTRLSGYSILDQYSLAGMREVGVNTTAHFDFEDSSPTLYCSNINNNKPCIFDNSLQVDSIINSPNNAPTDYPAEGRAYLRVKTGQMIAPHSINSPISTDAGGTQYLNFLLNTKDSGAEAVISIYEYTPDGGYWNKVPDATQTFSANQGWERKIMTFSGLNKAVIYLSVNSDQAEERYVYFDDINIEPVLRVANNQYIAKECRLYPSQESLSCTSANSKVISDGLTGYCLQHDPANKEVCLLWYPVDEINANMKSGRSILGYQGAFPLNYCTEANGNFELLEKRVAVKFDQGYSSNSNEWGDDDCIIDAGCWNDYNYNTLTEIEHGDSAAWKKTWCIPVADRLQVITSQAPLGGNRACRDEIIYEGWGTYDGLHFQQSGTWIADCGGACTVGCESKDCQNLDEAHSADPAVRILDLNYPTVDEDGLKLISSSDPEKVYYPTCNRFVQVVDGDGNNQAWADRVSKNSIYPYYTPLFFRDANYYYGPRVTCYLQEGDVRVPTSCSTPNVNISFDANAFDFNKYGRSRELVPFGAATFPDGFNIFASGPIKLRNQYSSKIKQEAFAGRPYGCSGPACSHIGYCSLDPNIYCILDTSVSTSTSLINQRSCGSAGGTCLPMWDGERITSSSLFPAFDSSNILKNIFLSSYDGYAFNFGMGIYDSAPGYMGDFSVAGSYRENIGTSGNICMNCHTANYDNNFNSYWRFVLPVVSNVRINEVSSNNGTINVQTPGVYKLTFNTIIDKEQQPLRDLRITWGDGSVQNLVNQDYRPNASQPHTVYHYYRTAGTYNIAIRITDNWAFFRNWP